MTCDLCGGRVRIETVPFMYRGQTNLGSYEAEVCSSCGEIFFSENAFKEIERRAKMMEIWGRCIIPEPEEIDLTVTSREIPTIDFSTLYGDAYSCGEIYGVMSL